jgi:hypothetical protein
MMAAVPASDWLPYTEEAEEECWLAAEASGQQAAFRVAREEQRTAVAGQEQPEASATLGGEGQAEREAPAISARGRSRTGLSRVNLQRSERLTEAAYKDRGVIA